MTTIRVLFLRSYAKAPFSANIARALACCPTIECWQYPAWPEDRRHLVQKLYAPADAWNALHHQVIASANKLRQHVLGRTFDLILLADYDGQLFHYQAQSPLRKAKLWLSVLRMLPARGLAGTRAHLNYLRALPLSLAEINRLAPVIAIDWTDSPMLTPNDQRVLRDCSLYFKRELPFDRLFLYYQDRPTPWTTRRKELLPLLEKVHHIPLGIEDSKYAALKSQRTAAQDIDVLFLGEITNTLRKTGMEQLQAFASRSQWKIVIKQGVPFDEYCRMIARSKITISIAGGGWDCFRHYEAVALGSVPLINKPTVDAVWWHSMPEAIFFENTFSNFLARIEHLLNDDQGRATCLATLEQQIEKHMLHSKIVEYIIQTALKNVVSRYAES